MVRALLLAVALVAFSPLASQAQYGRWDPDRAASEQAARRDSDNRGRYRDGAREDDRRNAGRDDRRNTMSPDERRELNRDLQRANREFYRKGKERSRRD